MTKRKLLYIVAMVIFELVQQIFNLGAAGMTETQPSGTINVSLEEYQELLKYKWEVINYESLHPSAITVEEANNQIDKAYREKDAAIAERDEALSALAEKQKKDALCWQAGASYIYAPGDQGVMIEAGVGFKNIMPTLGISWQTESGFGYSVGLRYVR